MSFVRRTLLSLIVCLMIAFSLQAQDPIQQIVDKAIEAANAAIPTLGNPDSWLWEQLPVTNSTTLGCPFASGTSLPNPVTPYRISLTYGADAYFVHVSADRALVQLCDPKFPAAGATATPFPPGQPTPTLDPSAVQPCTLSPLSTFSNVRSAPSTEAAVVETIFENSVHPVLGISSDSLWYLIPQGWVSSTVANVSANCANLPVSTVVIVGGTPAAAPSEIVYTCPPDFAGYLRPRITIGFGTAQIDTGGAPNRLRDLPATIGAQIGVIQPGRRFDQVISGPACNEGFVWWYVSIDGVQGWTAESNFATGEYFIAPTAGTEAAASTATAPDSGLAPVLLESPYPFVQLAAGSLQDSPLKQVVFSADNGFVLVSTETAGFGGAVTGAVSEIPLSTRELSPRTVNLTTPIVLMKLAPDNSLMVADSGGTVSFISLEVLEVIRSLEGIFTAPFGGLVDLSPDGSRIAAFDAGAVRLIDAANGQEIVSAPVTVEGASQLRFSPDGSRIALLAPGGIALWESQTLSALAPLPPDATFAFDAMAFNPANGLLLTTRCARSADRCQESQLGLWDTDRAQLLGVVPTNTGQITALIFSPEARFIAAGDENGIILLRRGDTGEEIAALQGAAAPVEALTFSADSRILVAAYGGENSSLWLWDLNELLVE